MCRLSPVIFFTCWAVKALRTRLGLGMALWMLTQIEVSAYFNFESTATPGSQLGPSILVPM